MWAAQRLQHIVDHHKKRGDGDSLVKRHRAALGRNEAKANSSAEIARWRRYRELRPRGDLPAEPPLCGGEDEPEFPLSVDKSDGKICGDFLGKQPRAEVNRSRRARDRP